ncbi:MAG: hypothetical protein NTX86_01220 [Candidatus Dependentiae bacterium]|nr:hypothetical protein [Candidatus Dependentiae bacterium]
MKFFQHKFHITQFIILLFIQSIEGTSDEHWKYGNIYAIGDSNAAFCFTNTEIEPRMIDSSITLYEQSMLTYAVNAHTTLTIPCTMHWIQGRTMHRIGRDGIADFNIKSFGVQENDIAIFLFGTIDVYGHIFRNNNNDDDTITKQMTHRDLDEIIDTLTSKYLQTITENRKNYDKLTVVIFACLPPLKHPFYEKNFLEVFPNQQFLPTQVNIIKKLNERLSYYSTQNNFLLLNVNDLYQDQDGQLLLNLSDGTHHIHPKHTQPLKNRLISMLIEHSNSFVQ